MKHRQAISLRGVRCRIAGKAVLDDVSLELPQRQLTGVIGNNGSGKTTLLRSILGLLPLESGRIEIGGQDLRRLKRDELARRVAILSQNTFSEFAFPCREIVLMGRNPHHGRFQPLAAEDYRIAEQAMRLTDTWRFKDRLITELSGGEEQTVFLARALAQTPRFLLLDEPTSHLDVQHQIKILELVKSLAAELGVVVVIHDLNMAARFCDRLALMSRGRVVAQGTPREVLTPANIERVFGVRALVREDAALDTVQLTFLAHGDAPRVLHPELFGEGR